MGARRGRGDLQPGSPRRHLQAVPSTVRPAPATWELMLATPPSGRVTDEQLRAMVVSGQWLFDLKWDGIRAALQIRNGLPIRLVNRNGVDIGVKFPELFEDPEGPGLFGDGDAIVDGELVCLVKGRFKPNFAQVLRRNAQDSSFMIKRLAREHPVMFMAFDLLALGGEDLRHQALAQRLVALTKVLGDAGGGRIQPTLRSPDGPLMWSRVLEHDLEGLIAKKIASPYVGGRSSGWVKLKNTRVLQACVVGWTAGNGARQSSFGALELALLDDQGNPVEVGQVGSGFSDPDLKAVKRLLASGQSFVVDVEYLEFSGGNKLRFPVFKGVRGDVALTDCTLDQLTRG